MKSFALWLVLAGAAIAAGIVVPYGVLAGGTTPTLFVFWCVFAFVVVGLVAAGTSGWRD